MPGRKAAWSLAFSLGAHALVLWWWPLREKVPEKVHQTVLRLSLRSRPSPLPPQPSSVLTARAQPARQEGIKRRLSSPSAEGSTVPQAALSGDSGASSDMVVVGVDSEAIRQQARKMGREGAGGGRDALASQSVSRPPSALAMAVGREVPVMKETGLNDGSRFIRFKNNTCLRIPRHVPAWRDPGIVPVQWIVTNCPRV